MVVPAEYAAIRTAKAEYNAIISRIAERSSGTRPELKSGPAMNGMPCCSVAYGANCSAFWKVPAIVTG